MSVEDISLFLGPIIAVVLTSGVVAAAVTFYQNRWLENRRSKEAERTRLRLSFAEAFAAYTDYKEFPYIIRRRRSDQSAGERARLSAELTAIQSRIRYYRAWTYFESPSVGQAYAVLITQMRKVVGSAVHDAWEHPATRADSEMSISLETVDLRNLNVEEDQYIACVTARLDKLTPKRPKGNDYSRGVKARQFVLRKGVD